MGMVKFSHIADCHLGAFGRNDVLREYNIQAFEKTIDISIDKDVDFIIIAGDLFHNPHPKMDTVNRTVEALMKAKREDIRVYLVYGSHDFNISEDSLIDVLESAEVFKKVVHYLESEEGGRLEHVKDLSGVEIAGLSGRKNRMDISYYKNIDFEEPDGESIFVFHSSISELKPADIHESETLPLSLLPSGYDYYAGGHIHEKIEGEKEDSPVIYPGPTFGSSYTDLEKEIERGFYIVNDWKEEYVPIETCGIKRLKIEADTLNSGELEEKLLEKTEGNVEEEIVVLKVTGTLREGAPRDINFSQIRHKFEENGVETVYLNRRNLEAKESGRIKIKEDSGENTEKQILEEYDYPGVINQEFAEDILGVLKMEQSEGETNIDYNEKIWKRCWKKISDREDYENNDKKKEKEQNIKDVAKAGREVEVDEKSEEDNKKRNSRNQISLMDFGGDG